MFKIIEEFNDFMDTRSDVERVFFMFFCICCVIFLILFAVFFQPILLILVPLIWLASLGYRFYNWRKPSESDS